MNTMTAMPQRCSSFNDYIDDIVESSSSSSSHVLITHFKDFSRPLPPRNYSSYTNIPSIFDKANNDSKNNSIGMTNNEYNDHAQIPISYFNLSKATMTNDDRRREIDRIIKHVCDGKLLSTISDERPASELSEASVHALTRAPITTTTTTPIAKLDEQNKISFGKTTELLPLDNDISTLQRELQEKELDITHLHKEIEELQQANKLLKAKTPAVCSNGYASKDEIEALQREKEALQDELRIAQESVAKFQQQQNQNAMIIRLNRIDENSVQEKETLEKKLRLYEKQMRTITDENERLRQHLQQIERAITEFKRENQELQQQLIEAKKRNDELFYQEFHSFRNDLKLLKQRNNELFEQNLRLQQERVGRSWHPSFQEPSQKATLPPSSQVPNGNSKNLKNSRSESPNMSEASDSTNYLATVSIERYTSRPTPSGRQRSTTLDRHHHYSRSKKYSASFGPDDIHRATGFQSPFSKSVDQQFNYGLPRSPRTTEWNEEKVPKTEDAVDSDEDHPMIENSKEQTSSFYNANYHANRSATFNESQHCPQRTTSGEANNQKEDRPDTRKNNETTTPKRPYAPSSINDIRLKDIIKFSRPGGKISKGIVKYIGALPGKNEQFLGLELETEDSKHDGIYQDKRLFQCKPNRGIFIGFSKVIMAWRNP